MAASLNRVMLIGNIGKEPECRSMQNGSKVANLSLATSESWKDKSSGEKKEKTEWHRIVVFGPLADIVERYVSKGSKVYVCGSIQTRKWEKNGEPQYSTEVVLQGFGAELILLDGGKDRAAPDHTEPQAPQRRREAAQDDSDRIPF